MKKLIDLIQEELVKAFTAAEMDPSYARVSVSNRPDLCEYQCNGAMAAAKAYHKAPIQLAEAVVEKVTDHSVIGEIEAVKPGFINLKINPEFLADYLSKMQNDEDLSKDKAKNPKTIIVDYGGANVAKPLHVGHLRSAIIGESIKRMGRFMGHNMIGDVHLGDWGLQMGLIITELQERHPELVYFDESFCRGEKTRNQVEQCRFSAPGGTDQSNKFPFADRKGDVFQGVGFSFQCMVSIMNVFQFQCILHDNPPDTETIISLLLTVYEK